MVKICEVVDNCEECPRYGDDCDGEIDDAEGDDLIIKGAKGIKDGLYNITDGKLFKYKANGGTVRTYPIVPSADAVDCTDFIDWIRKVVADEELWELNAVGYGEIICRKLVKVGALATTEKPPYYYVPSVSADAEQETVPTVVRVTMSDGSQYYLEHERDAIQADAVQGEWKIDEYGIYHCPFCHAINNTVYKSFCPNCGARMENTK